MTASKNRKEEEANMHQTNSKNVSQNPTSQPSFGNNSIITRIFDFLSDHELKHSYSFQSLEKETEFYNLWADFWRYCIGINVIPAESKNKKPSIKWKQFQDAPIPLWQHQRWKDTGAFNSGLAIILGKTWHREDRKNLFLICIDADKRNALEELCTRNGKKDSLEKMAQKFLIEQHKDNRDRAHIYFYSPISFPSKSPDSELGLEIKEHGLSMCSPSIHRDGRPYEIIGVNEPIVLTSTEAIQLIQHINQICVKSGIKYLQGEKKSRRLTSAVNTLKIDTKIRIPNGERHVTLLSVADSLLLRHLGKQKNMTEQKLKEFLFHINDTLCDPEPLLQSEMNNIWDSATDFVQRIKKNQVELSHDAGEEIDIIEEASESIKSKYRFATIEETKDILYYNDGVYAPGGEVLIEKEVELNYSYNISNKRLAEIKGHLMRSTYRSKKEFDSDLNILNLKNGLYDITLEKLKEHNPDYLSINQIPISYNHKAKPKRFGKYLKEVLYPKEIRTAVEIMGYTLYRDNPFEIITTLFGYGANGKSVFTSLVTTLHGMKNVSNVPLSALLKDTFALSDLENKSVNFDTELSNATIYDTAILKRLTGNQPVRIQRKNQRAYDTILYTKLFFSANRIPQTTDDSDAYYRRNIILSFPNQFEEGNNADSDLINKLTAEEELSGIFNVLIMALRRLLKNKRIFVHEKTIQERRDKYELAVNPIDYFKKEAIAEDSLESDRTLKETLYRAYEIFTKGKKLPMISKENLGKTLKKHRFQDGRESSGRRRNFWKGVRLTEKYSQIIGSEQQTLTA